MLSIAINLQTIFNTENKPNNLFFLSQLVSFTDLYQVGRLTVQMFTFH